MKNLNFIPFIFMMLGASSCVEEITLHNEKASSIDADKIDFTNFTNTNVSITLLTESGMPVDGVLVKLYPYPFNDQQVILKGITDKNGKIATALNMGNHIESVVLEINYIGLPNFLIVHQKDFANIKIQGQKHDFTELAQSPNQSSSNVGDITSGNTNGRTDGALALPKLTTLGSFDANGVPSYLMPVGDVISPNLLSFINASLPETKPVPTFNPRYLDDKAAYNLEITETCDVWMTFVHEGAGYKNSLGFYTFKTGSNPKNTSEIQELLVAFPNASFLNSGGGLRSGDKVHLGRFEPNTTLGFALIANGFKNGTLTTGDAIYYSDPQLNPEATLEKKKHNVLLYDDENKLFLVGFEDLNRDGRSDDDFNDAMYYISSNPVEAISIQNVNPINKPLDTDGDGVNDVYDEYPTDPRYAYKYDYPSSNSYGTLAFEDQWPNLGDYDFNDLVVDYRYGHLANGRNQLVKMENEFLIKAVGAGFQNGFGFQMDLQPNTVQRVTGMEVSGDWVKLGANGTESGQSRLVIIVTDDAHRGFTGKGFINTDPNQGYQAPRTVNVSVEFVNPLEVSAMYNAPYNPFLMINKTRGRELHLPGYKPTDLVDASFFGTANDNTQINKNQFYRATEGLPWAMNIPQELDHMHEKVNITKGYLKFNDWIGSQGFSFMDWFVEKPGYREDRMIFKKKN